MIKLVNDTIDKQDIENLRNWLKDMPRLTKGNLTIEFEKKFAAWQGSKYAVYVNSGSSANLLMLYALRTLKDKKNVIIAPALSWVTTIAPILQFGYDLILCDTEQGNLGLNIEHLKKLVKLYHPLAIVGVNVLGFPCNYIDVLKLCSENNVLLLEDNCENIGSVYHGQKCGTFGTMSSFSFYFGHHISTIEGGMICTNNQSWYELLLQLRSHGWDRDLSADKKAELRETWEVDDFQALFTFYEEGFNLRATDLQAYIGIKQIDKLDYIVKKRYENYLLYKSLIKDNWIFDDTGCVISNHAYPIIHAKKNEIVKALKENDIECRPIAGGSMEKQPFYIKRFGKTNNCLVANLIHELGFYVPNNQDITQAEIQKICKIINKVIA